MTQIQDFSKSTQNMIDRNIKRAFADVVPKLERWFDSTGGLTRNRLIFFERYWDEQGGGITRFEYEDRLQQLRARYLANHSGYTIVTNRKGRIYIRNTRGKFVAQPKYVRDLYRWYMNR